MCLLKVFDVAQVHRFALSFTLFYSFFCLFLWGFFVVNDLMSFGEAPDKKERKKRKRKGKGREREGYQK